MEKAKTYIKPLKGEDSEYVVKVVCEHPEWYGKTKMTDWPHCHFYGVYDEEDYLLGFFAFAFWKDCNQVILCCVYVKEQYRKMGLFNKMVKFFKNKCSDYTLLVIGARDENKLANEIYNNKFRFSHYDKETNGNWYIIRDSR